jgi:hypothetical protein
MAELYHTELADRRCYDFATHEVGFDCSATSPCSQTQAASEKEYADDPYCRFSVLEWWDYALR